MTERIIIGDRVAIWKRGKRGIFQADFHYRGQHCLRSLKTSNRKIAVERATKLAAKIIDGALDGVDDEPQCGIAKRELVAAIIDYQESNRASGLARKTIGKYHGTLMDFAEFARSKRVQRVDQISLKLFDEYRSHRSNQKVRGKVIGKTQMYHDASLLKRFLQWCADRHMIAANPLAAQKFSKPTPKRKEFVPTLGEIDLILSEVPKRIQVVIAVLAFGGMRSANCRNLLVEDVDLDGGWIYIRSREHAETKCRNEWKAPIHPRLATILKSTTSPRDGYLFTAPPSRKYPAGGHWINTKHLNDDFVKVVKKLGMPAGRGSGYTIHSLRHFFKSFCLSHGVPREYVDAWQGHMSIRSASDLYVHTFDAESQRLMARVPFGEGTPAADAGERK